VSVWCPSNEKTSRFEQEVSRAESIVSALTDNHRKEMHDDSVTQIAQNCQPTPRSMPQGS
jgi:hypothetical protein